MIKISCVANSIKSLAQKQAGNIQQRASQIQLPKTLDKINDFSRGANLNRSMRASGKEYSIEMFMNNFTSFLNKNFRKGFQSVKAGLDSISQNGQLKKEIKNAGSIEDYIGTVLPKKLKFLNRR